MFSRFILLADISCESPLLVNYLGGLLKYGARQCLLFLCLTFQEAVSLTLSSAHEELGDNLHHLKRLLSDQGFSVEGRVVSSFLNQEINLAVAEGQYSLIAVASRAHSLLNEIFSNDPATRVARHIHKPVLLVPLGAIAERAQNGNGRISAYNHNHILYPTDFSESAERAFEFVRRLVLNGAKQVTLLYVSEELKKANQYQTPELHGIHHEHLKELVEHLERMGKPRVESEVQYGSPSGVIVRRAHELGVNLIVMGSRGHGLVRGCFMGSVSQAVTRCSNVPVLIIPMRQD